MTGGAGNPGNAPEGADDPGQVNPLAPGDEVTEAGQGHGSKPALVPDHGAQFTLCDEGSLAGRFSNHDAAPAVRVAPPQGDRCDNMVSVQFYTLQEC